MKLFIITAIVLAGCAGPPAAETAPPHGPASLRIVPPSYYSVRPGPRRPLPRQAPIEPTRVQGRQGEPMPSRDEPPPAQPDPQAAEMAAALEAANRRLDLLNSQLQRLRRSITRPANPRAAGPEKGPEAVE